MCPARTTAAAAKLELKLPEHLKVIDGKLEKLEELLRPREGLEVDG